MKDLDSIYFAARKLHPEDRPAYLTRACEGDQVLRARVEQMLAVSGQTETIAVDLPDEAAPERKPGREPPKTLKLEFSEVPDEAIGQKIGRYKILERVGEGGCGVVYVAEQTEPVRRRVALKVIKLGMDTKQVVARFEAERQALAMMDHPNIAKVLDGGATDNGRPYFIMELVRGIRITDYCDQASLPTKDRLNLFIQVCQAIQHAHQKGIIHRDIKPSNILVTVNDGVPVPKVIDFGIAKATEGRLTDATVYTQLHQFIGTPAYMSPEQAEMSSLDIDTRSDIYSLGVLLYELLAGTTPFDARELMSQGIDAMRRTIREKEPVRPSTRLAAMQGDELTTAAKRRAVEPPRLIHQLKGDLDWIVMKCLEKDRTRRYETANGVAADIKRHLNNEPVVARPPSKLYEFQRMVRRHKVGFAAAAAVILALAAGIVMTTWQAIRATHAKQDAVTARQQAVAKEKEAVAAQNAEVTEELVARQRAYNSDMNVAMQALNENNLGRALDLLNRQRPNPGQKDLRGWEWRYLWQQTRSDALFTLCQKSGEIQSLAASHDGNLLAVGTHHKGGASVWDLRTRREVAHLAEDGTFVWCAFSPVEPLLAFIERGVSASGTPESTLHFWDAAKRRMVVEIPLDEYCDGLAFSQDGKTLATSGGTITLWRASDGTKLSSYPMGIYASIGANNFTATPDLRLAAYASTVSKVRVVDLRSGKELWTAAAAPHFVTALALSPDGKTLASADGYGESDIYLWDVATGQKIGQLAGHNSWVGSLVFWPDGKKLASASADQTIRVWDVASRKCLDVMHGNRDEVWRLALLPDGQTLASGSKDGSVCLWDTSVTHARQTNITWPMSTVGWTFAPDSRSILTLDNKGEVARWTGADFQEKKALFEVGADKYIDISYYPPFFQDGRFLAISSTNGIISIWDVSRQVLWHQTANGTNEGILLCFDAAGNNLITGSQNNQVYHEWNLTSGLETQSWPGAMPYDGSIALSPDAQFCVIAGPEGDVVSRNLREQKNVPLSLDILEPSVAAFSPDGKLFALPSGLGYVKVWDAKTWKEVAALRGFTLGVHSVVFSRDGKRLATGGGTGAQALKLWETDGWQNVITLQGSGSIFVEPLFSPDGNSVGTLSESGILNVWHAPSWAEIHEVEARDKTDSP